MAYTKEQLLEMYRKLPKDLQDAIFSIDTAEAIRQIGEENKLMIDKIGELADETGLIMLGLTSPSQFIPHLTERLGVSRELARTIAQEINAKVFLPIRESLKKIHGIEASEPEMEAPMPPPVTPPPPPSRPATVVNIKPTTLGMAKPASEISQTPASPMPATPSAPKIPEVPASQFLKDKDGPLEIPKDGPWKATPTPAPAAPAQPAPTAAAPPIFEAKTKEEIFRLPAQVFEKPINPTEKFMQPKVEAKKIDPYREPPQ